MKSLQGTWIWLCRNVSPRFQWKESRFLMTVLLCFCFLSIPLQALLRLVFFFWFFTLSLVVGPLFSDCRATEVISSARFEGSGAPLGYARCVSGVPPGATQSPLLFLPFLAFSPASVSVAATSLSEWCVEWQFSHCDPMLGDSSGLFSAFIFCSNWDLLQSTSKRF